MFRHVFQMLVTLMRSPIASYSDAVSRSHSWTLLFVIHKHTSLKNDKRLYV